MHLKDEMIMTNHEGKDDVNLISDESDVSETFLYDSIVEQKNVETTPRSLMLMGVKSSYSNNAHSDIRNRKKFHMRSLSFAETVEPLTITWNEINVFADVRGTGLCGRSYKTGEVRQIVTNISGIAYPGKVLAIIGPSGCGKTTLLNVLNDRNLADLQVEGEVKINGELLGQGIKTVSAYVQDKDIFIGSLKVKEHLWFYSLMKMDNYFTMDDREARIEELLLELGLKKCADTFIGTPGSEKGISGGEMKRLSFASELLINPPIMFLDEPTSGLDSYMAENIFNILRKMARKNKTVICTIHQPNSELYMMFDEILILGDGSTVFMGSPKEAANFFKANGLACPVNFNPSDHFIHCIARKEDSENELVRILASNYLKTEEYSRIQKSIRETNCTLDSSLLAETTKVLTHSKYKVGWCSQLKGLLWRHWLSLTRDTNLFFVRIFHTLFLSVVIGLIYFRQDYNDPRGQYNINGAAFLETTLMTFNVFFTVLNTFPSELPVFFREYSAGMYRVDAYFLSRNIVDLLVFLMMPIILSCCYYALIMVDHSLETFFVNLFTNIAVCKTAASFGYFLSTVTTNIDLSLAISPPILFTIMIGGGYLVNLNSIMIPFIYVKYVSWIKFGFENLLINQWIDVKNITCSINNTSIRSPCFSNGVDMIKSLQFIPSKNVYYINFFFLLLSIILFRLASFACLYHKSQQTKNSRTKK